MEALAHPAVSPSGSGSSPGQRLGARVGRTGHLFETGGGASGRRMVIKLFPWATGLAAEVVRNFTEEATKVVNLRHPHVAPVTGGGLLDDGTPFVIMELMRGQTLAELLEQRGALELDEVVPVVRAVASALAVAHAAGVIHRELRADNVFMADVDVPASRNGFPRLLDFGAWRLTAAARAAGRIVRDASASEVAPEQRRDQGAGVDHRADQFALAALAYRLMHGVAAPHGVLTGPAFQRLWELDLPRRESPARRPGMIGPGAPAADEVLARAMSWRPEARFDSVASFLCAFEAALAPPPAPAVRIVASPPAPSSLSSLSSLSSAPSAPSVAAVSRSAAPALPASLTQQFFAEGDRQDAAALGQTDGGAADHQSSDDDDDAADETEALARSATFARVPRRRAPLIGAAALGLAALALIAHAATRSSREDTPARASESATTPPGGGAALPATVPSRSPSIVPLVASSRPPHSRGSVAPSPPRAAVPPSVPISAPPSPAAPMPGTLVVTPAPMPPMPAPPPENAPTEVKNPEPSQAAQAGKPAAEDETEAPSSDQRPGAGAEGVAPTP